VLRIGAKSLGVARDTQFQFADLREKTMQLALRQGRVNLDWRRLSGDETAQVDLSRGTVWLLEPGIYDIDSGAPDRPIRITVFAGSARFAAGGIDQTVAPGLSLVLSGTQSLSSVTETATEDDFSGWCRAHDYHPERLAASYHVSPDTTGYEELDSYGQWATAPQYGTVWYPQSVADDWAPYRDGHWVWIEPWGWNWVDDEPWGFAPFHYGRWVRIAARWAWVPGEFVPQPVYAPALVAFVTLPAAAGPVVGWFPLAPGEVYWPAYTRDAAYIRNINIANVNNATIRSITRIVVREPLAGPPPEVAPRRFANLASVVVAPARTFATAARVVPDAVAVPAPLLERAAVTIRPPPVVAAPLKGTVAATPNPALVRPHPPGAPNFAHLDAAPRVAEPAAPVGHPAVAEHGKVLPVATGKTALGEEGKPSAATATTDQAAEEVPRRTAEAAPRAAQEAAARQQAAARQAQQHAAQEAVARQQAAAQRAAQEAARRRAAQAAAQRAAQEGAARQQAGQAAAGRQAHPPNAPVCGQPGQPPCPH
jgi:hypothetical protein